MYYGSFKAAREKQGGVVRVRVAGMHRAQPYMGVS